MSKQKQKTIFVHRTFSSFSELGVFMYWTGNSMTNLLSYCGLVDAKIRPSDIDLPVKSLSNLFVNLLESLRYQKDTLKLTDI